MLAQMPQPLSAHEIGQARQQRRAVLLPGLLCDAALWQPAWSELPNPPEVVSIELGAAASIAAMADAVLAQAPERFSLAGFSMGGQVAMEVWARAPERVERLALLSTNHLGLSPAVRAHLAGSLERVQRDGLASYLHNAFSLYVAAAHRDDAALRSAFVLMGMRVGPEAAVRQMRALLSYDGFALLASVSCPVLLLGGSEDERTSPAVHQAMAELMPHARIHLVAACGHFTLLESPRAVALRLNEWLAG